MDGNENSNTNNTNEENTDITENQAPEAAEEPKDLIPAETNEIKEAEIPEVATMTQEMADAEYFAPVEEPRRVAESMFDWIEIFSSAFLTVILLFTFIFRLVTVDGSSMEATLHDKDNLIISHLFFTPQQGDIVVIQVPNYKTPLIKRVIATEGQEIRFDFDNWLVYVDGVPIYEIDGKAAREPYVNFEPDRTMNHDSISRENPVVKVEPGKIFVMGDNRNHSSDSRVADIGQIDVKNVVGRVLIRVFPFDKFGVVKPNEK